MRHATYDYIIIGAGTAGCVLANRLTTSGKHNVLLLEAGGPDRNIWIHMPLGYGRTFFNHAVNWMFETDPQPGLNDRRIAQPRGKVLGGSSSINGLLYVRGQREDYDSWSAAGNQGWSYEEVLPHFKRSEDQQRGGNPFHGAGGELPVSDLPEKHPLAEAFIESGARVGIARNGDFNGPTQEGIGYFQGTARRGLRYSTAKAFLRPALNRSNLDLLMRSRVQRIRFDGTRATGVSFVRQGHIVEAHATKEVILCAGAIQSPQILQLSGIGPAPLLRAFDIPVVRNLPAVGENLQDHLQARFVVETRDRITLNDDMASNMRKLAVGINFVLTRKGPLGWWAGIAGAFIRTNQGLDRPDVQFHLYPFSTDRKNRPSLHEFSAFTLTVCQLRPYSRGYVRIVSADALHAPVICPNYLEDPRDVPVLLKGMRIAREVLAAEPLASLVTVEREPGSHFQTDEQMLEFVRAKAISVYHPVGTCRMGIDEASSVVDNELQVHGMHGLRVIDASIMPTLVSGNTQAASIMIGEKGADLVLNVKASHKAVA
jgi:choline dehydrogenase